MTVKNATPTYNHWTSEPKYKNKIKKIKIIDKRKHIQYLPTRNTLTQLTYIFGK